MIWPRTFWLGAFGTGASAAAAGPVTRGVLRILLRAELGEPDAGFENIRGIRALKPLQQDGDRLSPGLAVELHKFVDEQEAEARFLVPERRQEKRRHARSRSA